MKSRFILLAAALVASPLAHAATLFDFDGATPATVTGTQLPSLVTLQSAYWETRDDDGNLLAVPGFRADSSFPVSVGDPDAFGYGPAISGNALDGTNGPVMFTFASALNLSNFGVTLDNSEFGNAPITGGEIAFGTNILFYDAADTLIGYIPVNQTVSGFTVADGGTFENVSKVILPSGAFYDNMSFDAQAVPEPSAAALGGIAAIVLLRRRRA